MLKKIILLFILPLFIACQERPLYFGVATLTPNWIKAPVKYQAVGNSVALLSGSLGAIYGGYAPGVLEVQSKLTLPHVFFSSDFTWTDVAYHKRWVDIIKGMPIAAKFPAWWISDEPFNPYAGSVNDTANELAIVCARANHVSKPVMIDFWGAETSEQRDSLLTLTNIIAINDYRRMWLTANAIEWAIHYRQGKQIVLPFVPGDATLGLTTVEDAWYYVATSLAHGSSGALFYTNLTADNTDARLEILTEWWHQWQKMYDVEEAIQLGQEMSVNIISTSYQTVNDYHIPEGDPGVWRYQKDIEHHTWLKQDVVARAWSSFTGIIIVIANDGSTRQTVQLIVDGNNITIVLDAYEGRVLRV